MALLEFINAKGRDVEHTVELTLEEAYNGSARVVSIMDPSGRTRRLEVKIPSGVKTGSRVRVKGEGGRGTDRGRNGDLWLDIVVRSDTRFERRGDDLYVDLPVSLWDAVLGAEVEVQTLLGSKLVLKVSPETQNGRAFRLVGQGMPILGSSRKGDLYAKVKVVLPTELNDREKELFEEMKMLRQVGAK